MAKLTVEACRAARGLLNWGLRDLADHAGVGIASVARFEGGETVRDTTIERLKRAFESAGVEITNGTGTGAKLSSNHPKRTKAAPRKPKRT